MTWKRIYYDYALWLWFDTFYVHVDKLSLYVTLHHKTTKKSPDMDF